MTKKNQRAKEDEKTEEPGMLERVATIVSGLLVLFVLSVLIWDATHPNAPAAFDVTAKPAKIVGNAYHVEVTVRNTGDASAKSVNVHVELAGIDTTFAETDLVIDWLPGRSRREVVGVFAPPEGVPPADVRSIKAEVRGYAVP